MKWQWNGLPNNRRYRKNTYACEETDHHSHWYCIKCFQCANPQGSYISTPTEQSMCLCNEEEYYAEYLAMTSDDNNAEDESQPEQLEDSNESEFNFSDEETEYILDGKGQDWKQDLHNIFLNAAEFRQTTIKRMNGT